jgi:hypothetical protein
MLGVEDQRRAVPVEATLRLGHRPMSDTNRADLAQWRGEREELERAATAIEVSLVILPIVRVPGAT